MSGTNDFSIVACLQYAWKRKFYHDRYSTFFSTTLLVSTVSSVYMQIQGEFLLALFLDAVTFFFMVAHFNFFLHIVERKTIKASWTALIPTLKVYTQVVVSIFLVIGHIAKKILSVLVPLLLVIFSLGVLGSLFAQSPYTIITFAKTMLDALSLPVIVGGGILLYSMLVLYIIEYYFVICACLDGHSSHEAIIISKRIARKERFRLIGLFHVSLFVLIVGFLSFFVGAYLTIPLFMLMQVYAYNSLK
ncbi:MAG: hypothetical protein QM526_01405 [Alphaproteobacteria bacterium]|nr:hypothetical protein [Alphaproteobacteria bacterium]